MIVLIAAALIFLADRVTKIWVSKKIPQGEYREIVADKLYIANIKNKGAAYGFMAKYPELLMACTSISLVWLVKSLIEAFRNNASLTEKLGLAFILGGAAGNVFDRARKKPVTDFIYIKHKKWKNAPVFNIADIFIFIGALLYLFKNLTKGSK